MIHFILLINKIMKRCKACGNKVTPFLSLGKMPLANNFLIEKEILNEKKYDLTVGFCNHCFLVQLMKIVSPEDLFRDYIYFSSTSSTILNHNKSTSKYLMDRLALSNKSLVLEIASNDGALLQFFKE